MIYTTFLTNRSKNPTVKEKDILKFIMNEGNTKVTLPERITRIQQTTPAFHNKLFENYKGYIISITTEINVYLKNHEVDKEYYEFQIPKRSGGYRTILAPNEELKIIQRSVVDLLKILGLLEHNNAHAYIENRSIVTNAKAHKLSNHFIKFDFKDFFPSVTKDMLREVLPKIGILSLNNKIINEFIEAVINIATYKGSLPQGAVTSPMLSNLVLIPFDHALLEHFENVKNNKEKVVFTRYADDLEISSFTVLLPKATKDEIIQHYTNIINKCIIDAYKLPYLKINQNKTRVTTKYGKNRITGLKVNKDNNISIGYREKKQLKQDLASLIINKQNGGDKDMDKIYAITGMWSFLHAVEPGYAAYILTTLKRKFNITKDIFKYLQE